MQTDSQETVVPYRIVSPYQPLLLGLRGHLLIALIPFCAGGKGMGPGHGSRAWQEWAHKGFWRV